jgi:hypothetical protein
MPDTKISNARKIAACVIAGLLTVLLFFSSSGKLFFHPEHMGRMHLANWQIIV